MLRPPAAVCLDLDGTLADTDASVDAGVAGALAEAVRRIEVDVDSWTIANKSAATEVWAEHSQDWALGKITPLDFSIAIYTRTLETLGASTEFARDLVRAHAIASKVATKAYADVGSFMPALSELNIKTAIITNGASESQREIIGQLGFTNSVDAVVVSAEVGFEKPDSRIFLHALRLLDVPKGAAWHVGDSFEKDALGALSAGLQPVWLNRLKLAQHQAVPESVTMVDSLTELIPSLS